MQGDKMNVVFKGRMSGIWKRNGSKLTLIGDPSSGLGTIILSIGLTQLNNQEYSEALEDKLQQHVE